MYAVQVDLLDTRDHFCALNVNMYACVEKRCKKLLLAVNFHILQIVLKLYGSLWTFNFY